MRATRYHYTNDAISEATFASLREEAKQIDADMERINKTPEELDPEIQE